MWLEKEIVGQHFYFICLIFFWGGALIGTNDNTTRETQKAKIGNVFKGYYFF